MRAATFYLSISLGLALAGSALVVASPATEDGFTLARFVPDDVYLFHNARPNTEREFLDRYWQDVFDALSEAGITEDVMGLVGSVLGSEQVAEAERIKNRVSELVAGVDWKKLGGRETAFTERMTPPTKISKQEPPIAMPDMVLLFRGSAEGAAQNYTGLTNILEGLVAEINTAAGGEVLVVKQATKVGVKIASVNMLGMAPGAPPLYLSVALHDDVVIIALREQLFEDVLGLMNGSSKKTALANTPRFKSAFAKLPPAEDSMFFIDVQRLLNPFRTFIDMFLGMAQGPEDAYQNTGGSSEANALNGKAMAAYGRGDIQQALDLTEQAFEIAPNDSIVLYNLACFNARLGHKDEALGWLKKAVEGGFYAPNKIAADGDLQSLHDNPKFKAIVARAAELAMSRHAEDVIINGPKKGEAFSLLLQVHQAYEEKDYEQGLKLSKQAHALAPDHSRVLYSLACFHALLGHDDKALDFLEQAVDGGFYCPQHISKDPDWKKFHDHPRYQAAVKQAGMKAGELAQNGENRKIAMIAHILDTLMDTVGIIDYSAMVETTDGYSAKTDSITMLVPGAKDMPIYPVMAKHQQLTDFDRYLPQETVSFAVAGGPDLDGLYQFIEGVIRDGGPKGETLLAKWAGVQEQVGVNVRRDIIGWIQGDSVNVTLADKGGSVFMLKVNDEQAAREKIAVALEFLTTQLTQAAGKNPMLAMLNVRTTPVTHEQLEGFHNLYIGMSPEPVVWGVADGHLIFSSSTDAIALCLATAKGDHPNIRANAQAMSELIVPTGPFAGVSLTDQRNMGKELTEGIGVGATMLGMMGAFVPDPNVRPILAKVSGILSKLAPVVRKIDFYKSAASRTTFDGQAWRTQAVIHYVSPEERGETGAK